MTIGFSPFLIDNISIEENLSPRFDKAMNYYNKGKYSLAKDEFDYIIMSNPGSKMANESHYYMAEYYIDNSHLSQAQAQYQLNS